MKPLTLKFLMREWANFFFLIDNLAFPIDSMHRDYNRDWLDRFGQLSDTEKGALARYQSLKKAVWDKGGKELLTCFEAAFYQLSDQDPREGKELQAILTKDQFRELDGILKVFQERFRLMWADYRKGLSRGLAFVESVFSYVHPVFNQAFFAIGKLYRADEFPKQVEVYLMMRPDPGFVGGRMLSQRPLPKIMVESGVFDPQDQRQRSHLWLLLLHELTHACFESGRFFEFLYSYLDERLPLTHFLEKYPATKTPAMATYRAMREMIINAVVLNSYVRGKFDQNYKGKPKDGEALLTKVENYLEKKSLESVNEKRSSLLRCGPLTYQYIAWKLEKVVRPYLGEGRKMDKRFLDSIYKVLEEFPDNLLKDLQTKNKKGRS